LGLRILGYCYGARIRKIPLAKGISSIRFQKAYPLAPGIKDLEVYESHKFELVPPFPDILENYANNQRPVEAIKVRQKMQFAVQFHPEVRNAQGSAVLDGFLSLCK